MSLHVSMRVELLQVLGFSILLHALVRVELFQGFRFRLKSLRRMSLHDSVCNELF